MNRIVISLLTLFIAASLLLAQPAPQLSEIQRLKLLNSYQRAVRKQAEFEAARNDYANLADEVAKELKLPPQSNFVINADAGTVTVQLPPPSPPEPAKVPSQEGKPK